MAAAELLGFPTTVTELQGQLTPIFDVDVGNDNERRLTHLQVTPGSNIHAMLDAIRQDTRVRADKMFMLQVERSRDCAVKVGIDNNAHVNRWDNAVFAAADEIMFLVFPKSALVLVNDGAANQLCLDHTCKYMFSIARNAANDGDLDLTMFQAEVRARIAGAAGAGGGEDDNGMAAIEADYIAGKLVLYGNSDGRSSFEGFFDSPTRILAGGYGDVPAHLNGANGADRLYNDRSNSQVLRSISDKYWNHAGAANNPAPVNEALFDDIVLCWTLNVRLWANDLAQITDLSPVWRSKFNCTIKEELFGFGGTSEYRPHTLLPNRVDYLPPLIQDYLMTIHQHPTVTTASKDFEAIQLSPSTGYTIQVRNVESFDQETKDLQKTDIVFPLMLRYESSTSTVEFETMRGPPDKILVYRERDPSGAWSKYQPVIKTVEVKVIGQSIDSFTKLDATHVFYSTKRNSNFRSDAGWNSKYRGAVLLDRADLEHWSQWSSLQGVDNFIGSLTVQSSDEFDDEYQPSDDTRKVLTDAAKMLTVVFFYEDYSLGGELNNLRFWRI
jgi:hypothetical protein